MAIKSMIEILNVHLQWNSFIWAAWDQEHGLSREPNVYLWKHVFIEYICLGTLERFCFFLEY